MNSKKEDGRNGSTIGADGFPVGCPEELKELYVVLELGEKYIFEPIRWMLHPSTRPNGIAELMEKGVSNRTILATCLNAFLSDACFLEINDKPSAMQRLLNKGKSESGVVEGFLKGVLSDFEKKQEAYGDIYESINEIDSYCEDRTERQMIIRMLEEFNFEALTALGFNPLRVDTIRSIQNIEEMVRALAYNQNPFIQAMLERAPEPLITKIPGTSYYERNENYRRNSMKGDWYREAIDRFTTRGLIDGLNWADLGKRYLRHYDKKSGDYKEYKNITAAMKNW